MLEEAQIRGHSRKDGTPLSMQFWSTKYFFFFQRTFNSDECHVEGTIFTNEVSEFLKSETPCGYCTCLSARPALIVMFNGTVHSSIDTPNPTHLARGKVICFCWNCQYTLPSYICHYNIRRSHTSLLHNCLRHTLTCTRFCSFFNCYKVTFKTFNKLHMEVFVKWKCHSHLYMF